MSRFPRRRPSAVLAGAVACTLPLLPLAVAPAAGQAADPAALAAGLPDGRAVLERSVEAMGGRKAFESIRSMAVQLVIGLPNGELEIEALTIDENRLRLRLKATMERRVEAIMTKNGSAAWMTMQPLDVDLEPIGEPTLLPQIPTADLRRFGSAVRAHWMVLRLLEDYETIQTTEITQFNDGPALKVRITDPITERGKAAPAGERFMYVSMTDGMPLGVEAPVEGEGDPRQILTFSEVKQFGDLKLWTRMTGTAGPVNQSFQFKSITFNGVLPQIFDVPPAVQERLDEDAEAGGTAPAAPAAPVNPVGRGG